MYFESHLEANGYSIHTVRSYLHDLGLLSKWLRRTRGPDQVERIMPHHLGRVSHKPGSPVHRQGPSKGARRYGAIARGASVFLQMARIHGSESGSVPRPCYE